MYSPYKGLINPTGYNYGGQSLMTFEKYNHREYLNKVKAWPLNSITYQESKSPIIESRFIPYSNPFTKQIKPQYSAPKDEIMHPEAPRFFRRVGSQLNQNIKDTLHHPNQMWPRHKKYREKTYGQYLQNLNPKTDPYGFKESKYRTKNERKGLSYASNLMNFSFKEECILKEFNQMIEKKEIQSVNEIEKIILNLKNKFNIKNLDTFAKLFNHVQKQCDLSIQECQQIYSNLLKNDSIEQ